MIYYDILPSDEYN